MYCTAVVVRTCYGDYGGAGPTQLLPGEPSVLGGNRKKRWRKAELVSKTHGFDFDAISRATVYLRQGRGTEIRLDM